MPIDEKIILDDSKRLFSKFYSVMLDTLWKSHWT